MSKPLLILIEDDDVLGRTLQQRFMLEGYAVRWAKTAAQASEALTDRSARFVLSDIRLPDGSGEDVVTRAHQRRDAIPTIFMTAFSDIEQAVRLVKQGARDYIPKPFDLDVLVDQISAIVAVGTHSDAASDPYACFGISDATAALRRKLDRLARSDLPVLFTGETGTGKEVAARYLHRETKGGDLPFIAVNCAAIPAELFESAMFGHARGAFTGAHAAHTGYAAQAGEGTLFLDEIGELSLEHQAKLLRLIEAREFQPIGDTRSVRCTARIVCATNRDLQAAVDRGLFREDLLFRINIVQCVVPPLRERVQEIEPLLRNYVRRVASRLGQADLPIDDMALDFARTYAWPGNIRELVNRTERAIALNDTDTIGRADLWPDLFDDDHMEPDSAPITSGHTLAQARDAAEQGKIEQVLKDTGGNLTQAAAILAVSRTTLWTKIQKYGITVP